MSLMIESFESRVLLTASTGVIEADLAAGGVALSTAKADLKAAVSAAALDVKGFKTDVKGLKLTSTQKSALTTLEKAEAKDAAKAAAGVSKAISTGTIRGLQLELALKSLAAHPTKTSLQLKVEAALVKLQDVFSTTVISNAEIDASADVSTLDTDLAAVGTAIPSTQITVSAMESQLTADETTLSTDATALVSAVTTLSTDLA
jgi:hypothetical protein